MDAGRDVVGDERLVLAPARVSDSLSLRYSSSTRANPDDPQPSDVTSTIPGATSMSTHWKLETSRTSHPRDVSVGVVRRLTEVARVEAPLTDAVQEEGHERGRRRLSLGAR